MNILITGASSGIGYHTVKQFSKDLGNTVIAISRDASKLESLRLECLKENGSKIIVIPCDLSKTDSYTQLHGTINSHITHLDILINNAGYLVNKPFLKISGKELLDCYSVNVFAPFMLIQALLPLLIKSVQAQIINVGSMGGMNATSKFAGLSAYSSSKGALSILSECLAEDFKEYNIRVNCLAIGSVNTEMLKRAFPLFIAPHEATEMADFIVNFATKAAPFFNGKTIPVSSSSP